MNIIAYAHNGFHDKFGIPRQAREDSVLETRIVFTDPYRQPEAIRGIEGYSHLWLLWQFDIPQAAAPLEGGKGQFYYFDTKTGVMKTGWLQSGKTWYYLDTTSGAMKTNSWVSSANKWYYFDANGKMVTGWKQIGGKWYFFNSNGSMKANAWFKSGSAWYYFGSNGIMKTNAWQKTGSAWYYLQADGTMAVNKTLTISGKKYTFDKNGVLK